MTDRNHEQAKSTILSVLSDRAVNKVNFYIATWHVTPQLYRSVANAIRKDEIAIIHDPDLRKIKRGGIYIPKWDMLAIASASIRGTTYQELKTQQLIIHECTHAGFDYQNPELMTHLDNEAAAYVADNLFLVAKVAGTGKDARKLWVDTPNPANRKVKKTALQIAKNIYYDDKMPERLWAELEAGLRASPLYKDNVDTVVQWDGVGSSN